jgi:hypothetical protein
MAATAPPAGRYGRPAGPAGRRRLTIALWLLGVIALAVAVWLGLGTAATPVTWQQVGFTVADGQVEVVADITRPDPSVPVTCRLEALSRSHAQVGVVEVDVPAGDDRTVRLTATVRTSEPAVTGVVDECWVIEG